MHQGRLCPLTTIEPAGLAPVAKALPEWETVELMVDSGASETVMPEESLRCVATQVSEASKRGVMYEVANGQRIANLGEKIVEGLTDGEGHLRRFTAQVCDISKPLLSVKRLIESGHAVTFDSSGGCITHVASGDQIWLNEKDGMYSLKLWVPTRGAPDAGF